MQKLRLGIRGLLLAALLAFSARALLAQDPVKVAPESYKVTADNKYVRVLEVTLKPGAKVPMHSHPGYVVVAMTPCKVKFTSPGGKSQDVDMKSGESSWREAESHRVENLGTMECHALNVEVKRAARKTK